MKEFYTAFYRAIAHSPAHQAFCERVFGIDLGQHGFVDLEQIELLLQVTGMGPGTRLLDLGCGDGRIAEYLSDRSGAHITGLDYIPLAIETARQRTGSKAGRLSFQVGDLNHLELEPAQYDLILSLDTIYFSEDYAATLRALKAALNPSGRMAFFYSYGREPWVPFAEFPQENLPAERTPLGRALVMEGLTFRAWNLTAQDLALAIRRQAVLEELKPQFEAEGNQFIYENRLGDAQGIRQAIEAGLHARYLYLAWSDSPRG